MAGDVVRNILARFKVSGLDDMGKAKVVLDETARSTSEVAAKMGAYRQSVRTAAKELGVNVKISRRFVNTALQAGFSATEQAEAMEKIRQVAIKTGKPVEIIEKAWEGLARTLQNAGDATENLEDALRFQARSGIPEAEKAAARYAQTIGGGTDALKGLVGVGEVYAKQLDQIKDADLKARLTTKLARMELNRKRESIERVKDAYLSMSLRMKAALGPSNLAALKLMTKGIKLLAIAAGAALVGAFALAVQSIKKFIETDSVMKAAMDRTKEAVNDLQVALGSALVGGADNAGKALDKLTGKAKILTKFTNDNSEAIFEFSKSVVSAFGTALKWSAKLVLGFKFLGAAIGDALTLAAATAKIAFANLGRAGMSAFNGLLRALQQLLDGMIMLADTLGPNLVPDALRSVNLHEFLADLGSLNTMADEANATLKKGFVSAEAVLGDIHMLDLLANKLEALAMMGTDPVVDPTKRKRKRRGGGGGKAAEVDMVATPGHLLVPGGTQKSLDPNEIMAVTAANNQLADSFDGIAKNIKKSNETAGEFSKTMKKDVGDIALGALEDFGNGAAKAFGVAAAGGASFSNAIGALMKNIIGEMAGTLGRFFVLKGAAITVDPLLGGPALGVPLVAAGLALQAFGGAIGFSKGGQGASASTTAAATPSFQPREQEREEPRETTLVINIAGETVGPVIWRAMDEGLRLGHVTQMQGA